MENKQEENNITTPFDLFGSSPEEELIQITSRDEEIEEPSEIVDVEIVDENNLETIDEESTIQNEEEEGAPTEVEEYDVDIKANLAKYAAEALKAQGGLPDEFEITDDITEQDLDEAYVSYKEETLRNQIIREERARLAEEEGLTPEMIEEVKLKYYGIQDPQIQQMQYLEYLSSYQFDDKSETFEKDARDFLTTYYGLKNISESKIDRLVTVDLEDAKNLNQTISEAQDDLKKDFESINQQINQRVQDQQSAQIEQKRQNKEKVEQMLASREVAGVKYSDAEMELVRKALFDKTEVVVGADGKKYKTTLYYKKRLEASQSLEKNLQDKINFILGSSTEVIKNTERNRTTKKIMNRLNDYVDVKVKQSTKKSKDKDNKGRKVVPIVE